MQLAENMAHGLETHGPWLRMTQFPAPEFRDTIDALRQTEGEFARLRSEKAVAGRWMNAADEALTDWLTKARLAVMLARGVQWSETWLEAGFTHRCTSVPKATGPRIELARRVVDFLARNPQFGVAHANVTATDGRKLYDDIVSAQRVRRQVMSECSHAKIVRDAAERKLRRKMRGIVCILSATIKAADARWLVFGLKQPRVGRAARVSDSANAPAAITPIAQPEQLLGAVA